MNQMLSNIEIRYRRYELASRFAVYYTAVAVAGGLSGLLAGVITEYLDGARGIAGWRWLFVRVHLPQATPDSANSISDHRRLRFVLRRLHPLVLHGRLPLQHTLADTR